MVPFSKKNTLEQTGFKLMKLVNHTEYATPESGRRGLDYFRGIHLEDDFLTG